jgi:hypothetical protein
MPAAAIRFPERAVLAEERRLIPRMRPIAATT